MSIIPVTLITYRSSIFSTAGQCNLSSAILSTRPQHLNVLLFTVRTCNHVIHVFVFCIFYTFTVRLFLLFVTFIIWFKSWFLNPTSQIPRQGFLSYITFFLVSTNTIIFVSKQNWVQYIVVYFLFNCSHCTVHFPKTWSRCTFKGSSDSVMEASLF